LPGNDVEPEEGDKHVELNPQRQPARAGARRHKLTLTSIPDSSSERTSSVCGFCLEEGPTAAEGLSVAAFERRDRVQESICWAEAYRVVILLGAVGVR
jgi:hypothetical protein